MARRSKYIADPDSPQPTQYSLFLDPNLKEPEKRRFNPYPRISRNESDIAEVLSRSGKYIGYDLEFSSPTRPTILGVANDDLAVSIPWSSFRAQQIIDHCKANNKSIVAFSTIGADKSVTDRVLGNYTSLPLWDDGMLSMFYANAELAKEPGKTMDEDESDSGSLGMFNLGVGMMLYTDAPQHKNCRGIACEGPCPRHEVFGYNAIDAWGGLKIHQGALRDMERKKIPHQLYRELLELSSLCHEMEQQGVLIDRAYVADLDRRMEEGKASLFPYHRSGKKDIYDAPYNPKSSKQVREWFWQKGIELIDTDKETIDKVLEKECKKAKIPLGEKSAKYDALCEKYGLHLWSSDKQCVAAVDDGDVLRELFRLHLYKSSGKGPKSWFADQYFDLYGRVHPRYNVTGSSTCRVSSSGPNFTNLPNPRTAFGKAMRRAVKASPGMKIVKADASQLELRMMLYLAGFDPSVAGVDAFTFLVTASNGTFEYAASRLGVKPRDLAKVLSHGSNYGLGMVLLYPNELQQSRIRQQIQAGALYVCKDWQYAGGYIGFNGVHIAETFFGNASWENRKQGIELQQLYFTAFPQIQQFQRKVISFVEQNGYVQTVCGTYLPLLGDAADRVKKGLAMHGQGTSALHMQAILLRMRRELGVIPLGFVHDEIIREVPDTWTDKQCVEAMQIMTEETWRLPGFKAPVKVSVGPTWGDAKEVLL
jgi:hypothetical protein